MNELSFLQSVSLFREFDSAEVEAVESLFRSTSFGAAEVILEEGAVNRGLHIVRSGRIQVTRRVDSDEIVLSDLTEGQMFGELSILEDGRATATLRTIDPTRVLSISINNLAVFLGESPSAGAKFWRAMAIDLRGRLIQSNDLVRSYFEVNRALIENPAFREAYALCSR